jgi:hypothetical protein
MEDGKPTNLDDASVEAIARRVCELLGETRPSSSEPLVITADELARRLRRKRAWVYANADQLGVLRLGEGPRPRLMFDPAQVEDRLRSIKEDGSVAGPSTPRAHRPRPRKRVLPEAELLAIGSSPPRPRRRDGT